MKYLKVNTTLIRFVTYILLSTFFFGCSLFVRLPEPPNEPVVPSPPEPILEDIKKFLQTPANLDSHADGNLKINNEDVIAIMEFKEPSGSGAGSLAADQFILELKRRKYNVVERDKIKQILQEQEIIGTDRTKLSDFEIAKRIGKLIQADKFLFGAVTEYRSENRNIAIPRIIPATEKTRYKNDYDTYLKKKKEYKEKYEEYKKNFEILRAITLQPQIQPQGKKPEALPELKPLDRWVKTYKTETKSVFAAIANIGLTAKLIDIKSGKVVWVGQSNVMDTSLNDGMDRIVDAMLSDILDK